MTKHLHKSFLIFFLLCPLMIMAQRNFYLDGWKAKSYEVPESFQTNTLTSAQNPDAIITVNTSVELAKVLPTHFGSNTTFRNGSDQRTRTHLYTNSGHGIMRFPAGSGSNKYFWDGNIPSDMEQVIDKHNETIDVAGINGTNGNYMTPDIFAQFIKDAGSQATVVVNYFYARYGKTAEGTREARVQQAADYAAGFVRKMNIELGANIQNWEIGNECYGKWEEGYNVGGSIVTGKEYGEDFRVFAEAMKAVDPNIKVGAVVTREDDDWNSQLLPEIKDHADFLAVHNYFTTTNDATPENVLASVGQMGTIFTTLQDCVAKYTDKTRDYFPIAMTEYNSRGVYNTTMMNGLFITQILGELIKSGYGMGTIWVSEWSWSASAQESKGILARDDPDQADYTPRQSYIPYQYYHRCFGDKMVDASSNNADIKVYASTFNSGEIGLVIVNPTAIDNTVSINLDQVSNGVDFNKVWWYDFYADNMNQGNKRFYLNGTTGTTPGGGPDNFATLDPYYSDYQSGNTFQSKKYSVQFLVLKTDIEVVKPEIIQDGAEITLSSATSGANIYYTTDGSDPNALSTLYEGTFTAPPGSVIKAIAIKDMVSSDVASLKLQYNVLFIAIDDLRPVLNCYGESQIISPNIDALADQGIVFEKAYCQWSVCGPSRASFLSGLTPDGTGIRNLSSQLRTETPGVVTMPEYFKNNGYTTAAAGKIFDPRNVDDGHDSFSWSIPYTDPSSYTYPEEYGDFVQGKNYRVTANTATEQGPVGVGDDGYTDGQIALDALGKLDDFAQNSNQPFFLAVGFKKPHIPFIAPDEYWNLYDRNNLDLASFQKIAEGSPEYAYHTPEPMGYVDIPDPWTYDDVSLGNDILDPDSQRKLIHGYYACVSYIDAQVGLLMDKLKEKGLDKNTVIMILGDHGYHLGDHNQWGKHTQFENSVRAPLIISAPGGSTGSNTTPVEFTDVYPTLCELSGLEIPTNKLQGESLAGALRGESLTKTVAVSEYRAGGGSAYSFRTGRYRLSLWFMGSNDRPDLMAWNSNRIKATELYDYETDPNETRNLANDAAYASVVSDHLAIAEDWWNKQNNFLTGTPETDLSLPFIEHFENYTLGTSMVGDFWLTENSLWDRIWKGTYVNSFSASVVDDSDNAGTNALEFSIQPTSKGDGGIDIKLRTKSMLDYQGEYYQVSYRARTDVAGDGKASIGADMIKDNRHVLSQDYQYYFDTVTLSSEKLFIYFNNADFNTNENYKVWIDDLKISYHYPTGNSDVGIVTTDKPEVNVYPNPVSYMLNLNSDYPVDMAIIYSMEGRMVKQEKGDVKSLDFSHLDKGVYLVYLQLNNTRVVKRIIKQ
ncbi:T9SS type A sorting domain-containing protein [Labilibacter sediminis]|nr:T9SS type A sorting domain-containing protein [Labilibacter sediminis]